MTQPEWVITAWQTPGGYQARASSRGVQALGRERQTRLEAIEDALCEMDLLRRRAEDTREVPE